jgi:peptide deformylase
VGGVRPGRARLGAPAPSFTLSQGSPARGPRITLRLTRAMAVRTILHYPDPRLRQPGRKVEAITPDLRQLISDMAETMYAAPGVGLAATQIGEPWQVFVVDCAPEGQPSDLRVFVNPEILSREGAVLFEEGCLSFPTAREEIERAQKVLVRAQDPSGEPFELEADGLLAIAIQHEYDHLQGVLMIDRLGPLKKRLLHRQMLRQSIEGATASG